MSGGPGLILFLFPWVAAGVFMGMFPEPSRLWLRVPYWIAGCTWFLLGVVWDVMLITGVVN